MIDRFAFRIQLSRRVGLYLAALAALSVGYPAGNLVSAQEGAVPTFKDGQAQIVPGFQDPDSWIKHDLWVEAEFDSDGDGKNDRMHVSVCRQAQTESEGLKVPVVYVSSPYFSGTGSNGKQFFWDPKVELGAAPKEHETPPPIKHQSKRPSMSRSHWRAWVPRGFAVVHSASPGTGLSQGCPTVGGKNESLAPKAVVDWLCGRAKGYTSPDGDEEVKAFWSTGKVGMTGTSYNGTIPLAAATTGVEGLEAIIPVAPNTSYYHYYRSHGLVRHPGGYMGEDIDVLYDFINSGDPKMREYCDCNIRDMLMKNNQDRVTGDYNDFWAGRDYLNQLDDVKAATLMAHAFNDWNVMPEHSVRIYLALKEKGIPVQAFFHQGGHGGEPPIELMNRWFTRYLYGIENGVENDPKSWVVREGDRRTEPTSYPDYPHPDAKPVRLALTPGAPGAGSLKMASGDAVESGDAVIEKLIDDVSNSGAELASSDESPNRLLYVTPTLKTDVHLSGTSTLKIRLASSKPAANLSVWVVSLPWTKNGKITDNIITRGWADPQNAKSLRESAPLEPGKFYDLEFTLQPDDQVIPAGQQIGVMIFSSDKDFTLWPEAGTELQVDLSGTSIEMPVLGGADALKTAFGGSEE